jgi:hypothetical protein
VKLRYLNSLTNLSASLLLLSANKASVMVSHQCQSQFRARYLRSKMILNDKREDRGSSLIDENKRKAPMLLFLFLILQMFLLSSSTKLVHFTTQGSHPTEKCCFRKYILVSFPSPFLIPVCQAKVIGEPEKPTLTSSLLIRLDELSSVSLHDGHKRNSH